MPVTLPAHAAAILPFLHRRLRFLPPVALVVGSTAPDLAYLTGIYGTGSHTLPGLFTQAVPKGLLAYLWVELLLLPMVRERLPVIGTLQLARFTVTRGLPRTAPGWVAVLAALGLGALTHLLWDGLTHVGWWPERHLFFGARVTIAGQTLAVARVLWLLSSGVGSLIVLGYLARLYPRLTAPSQGQRGSAAPLLWALALGLAFGLVWRTLFPSGYHSAWQVLWSYFWAATRYASVALTVLGLHDAWRRHRARLQSTGPEM